MLRAYPKLLRVVGDWVEEYRVEHTKWTPHRAWFGGKASGEGPVRLTPGCHLFELRLFEYWDAWTTRNTYWEKFQVLSQK